MSFLYPIVSDLTASLNSGSYLNKTDYNLFVKGNISDLWYGISNTDAIEFSVYDLNDNLLYWNAIENIGTFKSSVLTYYDAKNNPVYYTLNQFVSDRPLYKNQKILVEPIADLSSSNLPSGDYIISYEFTRYLAGSPTKPLIVKEISPSRRELKLIPSDTSSIEYTAFCLGKVRLDDVSSLYLQLTDECPYSTLYTNSQVDSQDQINFVKNLFFIPNDGKFIDFLKFIYEDFVNFSIQTDGVQSFTRIQGIKTYFSNFLVSNTNTVQGFEDIENNFRKFVNERLDLLFVNYKSDQYSSARDYLFKIFVDDYFLPLHNGLKSKYNEKYKDPLKNLLSYATGKYIPILATSYLDERQSDQDPLTLLVKLQTPINDDISIKSSVWVSNGGMIPVLFNAVIKEENLVKTIKISPADFTVIPQDVSFTNVNKYYNNLDLQQPSDFQESLVDISKKINELNIDYSSSLSNFVIFSSAEIRHKIFKNKMISLSSLSSSLSTLNTNYSSSAYSYPYYTTELESIQSQQTDILSSFDGWESYLYKTGNYSYDPSTRKFENQSAVDELDANIVVYDKFNRDSLVNNTPEHILVDSDNDDYLIFLSMVGHFFDNISLYIKSLPVERASENNNNIARSVLQQMLQSFGWNIDASLENLSISNNYLDSDLTGTDSISADERTRQVWNRILNNLPILYKTKGTEECVRILLNCYGVPSTMINVKEYGGIDYSSTDKTSYTIEEKLFMLTFKGQGEFLFLPYVPTTRTVEFKVAFDTTKTYLPYQDISLVQKYDIATSELNWTLGFYKEPQKNLGRAFFQITDSSSLVRIETDSIPIFTGDIFSVMIRKNDPSSYFESNDTVDLVPAQYDLRIQRNEDGREIFNVSASCVLTRSFNVAFESSGDLLLGNYANSSSFVGMLDKILVWDTPIRDETFNEHCNDLNSYSYTGSAITHQTLYYRLNFDYPVDLSTRNPYTIANSNTYNYNNLIFAYNFGIQSLSASVDSCVTVSHSVFPYQFTEIPYNQTFAISSYGPNKFKNNKIQQIDMTVDVRLDPDDRSSYSPNLFMTPDSNQIGLFADPNRYKNQDIFRYLGDYKLMSTLADPSQMFDDRYYPLKNVKDLFNQSGNKRVLFTEMFILYRFYFDKSIFEAIKQLIPARNNVWSGILIEPTVLERPKYQYKHIVSEIGGNTVSSNVNPITSSVQIFTPSLVMGDSVKVVKSITGDFISADFRLDRDIFASQLYENVPFYLPPIGPYSQDLYHQFLSLKPQLVYVASGWIKKYPDVGQLNQIEQHPDWPIPAADYGPVGRPLNSPILVSFGNNSDVIPGFYPTGSGYYYLKNCYFYPKVNQKDLQILDALSKNLKCVLDLSTVSSPTFCYPTCFRGGVIKDISNPEELGVHCDNIGKVIESVPSGSHARYMIKKWSKDITFVTTGSYKKPQTMSSQSLYFYTTEFWQEPVYADLVYVRQSDVTVPYSSLSNGIVPDYSPTSSLVPGGIKFHHDNRTFYQRPNTFASNVFNIFNSNQPYVPNTFNSSDFVYYETITGYSRNHLTHKRLYFSNEAKPIIGSSNTGFERYVKSRQTLETTVDANGLANGSLPVQSVNVSNINVVKTNNVINK